MYILLMGKPCFRFKNKQMNLGEFYDTLARSSAVEVQSAYNGKLLCKSYRPEKHSHLSNRQIIRVWAEMRVSKGVFGNYAKPIICVFVDGHEEFVKEYGERKENA